VALRAPPSKPLRRPRLHPCHEPLPNEVSRVERR
jgi:hypothetical protein